MHKWVLSVILITALLFPLKVSAQTTVSFASMSVEIWPEYDKPSVLVIYRITFDASTSFPATVAIRIPTAAGEPNAVAERQADGSLYTLNFTRQVNGEWASISFTTTSSEVQIEYYDPSLVINGASHHYEYIWPGDFAIAQMSVRIQQPVDATSMRIAPNPGAGATGEGNLTYYILEIGSLTAVQSIQITIDYLKSTQTLTAQSLPISPSGSIPRSTISDLNISTVLPWILGILGAGLIIGGLIWFWRSGRQRPSRRIRTRPVSAQNPMSTPDSSPGEDAIYCSQCGKRASPGDLYCRSCGSQIRAR